MSVHALAILYWKFDNLILQSLTYFKSRHETNVVQTTKPNDIQGLWRIFEMTNNLAKFLSKLSDVYEPRRQLTRKEQEFPSTFLLFMYKITVKTAC